MTELVFGKALGLSYQWQWKSLLRSLCRSMLLDLGCNSLFLVNFLVFERWERNERKTACDGVFLALGCDGVRNSSLNETMQSTSASSSSHGVISDASTVKILQRNIILSESEEQVSPVNPLFNEGGGGPLDPRHFLFKFFFWRTK